MENKPAYDGNKVVSWNTCHWQPRVIIKAATYTNAMHVLSHCMDRLKRNRDRENRRGN